MQTLHAAAAESAIPLPHKICFALAASCSLHRVIRNLQTIHYLLSVENSRLPFRESWWFLWVQRLGLLLHPMTLHSCYSLTELLHRLPLQPLYLLAQNSERIPYFSHNPSLHCRYFQVWTLRSILWSVPKVGIFLVLRQLWPNARISNRFRVEIFAVEQIQVQSISLSTRHWVECAQSLDLSLEMKRLSEAVEFQILNRQTKHFSGPDTCQEQVIGQPRSTPVLFYSPQFRHFVLTFEGLEPTFDKHLSRYQLHHSVVLLIEE